MKRVSVWAILLLAFWLISERASYAQTGEAPAAANLARQAANSEAAKIDTIATVRGMFFMTTNQNNPPDYRAGVYRSAPQTSDSLWFSIAFGDSMQGKELDEITFYGARFDNDIATWEVHLFEVKEDVPADLTLYDKIQRWAYQAPKVRLGNLTYELNSPKLGQVEAYKQTIRPGFELAGRRFAFLVKRPPFNANSLKASENKFSAFAGIQLTARKASSGNVLTGSLAGNGIAKTQSFDWLSWGLGGAFVLVAAVTILGLARRHRKRA